MNLTNTESSVISQNNKKHREQLEQLKQNGGFFQRFEWMPEGYGIDKELKRMELVDNKMKETQLHPHPFNANQNKKLLKFEYPFQDHRDEKFVYGFLCQNDPYEATKDERLRAKWIEEAKMLFGEFKPAGP